MTTWDLRKGKVHVIEDDSTGSLVMVANDLQGPDDKVAVLEEVLLKLREQEIDCVTPSKAHPRCVARQTEAYLSF